MFDPGTITAASSLLGAAGGSGMFGGGDGGPSSAASTGYFTSGWFGREADNTLQTAIIILAGVFVFWLIAKGK